MKAKTIIKYEKEVIDFPDVNFKKYLVSLIDTDGDGEISLDEALSISSLTLIDKQIENLAGIEFFVNLKRLDCSNNNILTLDVSKNHQLESLRCVENRLYVLRIEGCKNLNSLFCNDNRINTIDLRDSTKLEILHCQNNFIDLLVLSRNINLDELQALNNPLKIIEVSSGMLPKIISIPESTEIVELGLEELSILDSLRDS